MTYILLTLTIVGSILVYWCYRIVKYTLYWTYIRYQKTLRKDGVPKTGRITEVTVLSSKGRFPLLECEFEFPNLSGELIREIIRFKDSRPHEQRYQKGLEADVILDTNSRSNTLLTLKSQGAVINWKVFLIFIIPGLTILASSAYLLLWATEKIWVDIPKYEQLFANRNIQWLAIGLLLVWLLLHAALGGYFSKKTKKKKRMTSSPQELRLHGLRSVGRISGYVDTGVMINENPVVRFFYRFKGKDGRVHQGNDRLTINKLDVGLVRSTKEKPVFYLPSDPQHSALEENVLDPSSMDGTFTRAILVFMAIVFSFLILGEFIDTLW